MKKQHKVSYRVYYEDTDAGGVVYYANYLKFAERARTELLRSHKINQSKLAEDEKILFVVKRAEIDLKKPARLDDIIDIYTEVNDLTGASVTMRQLIKNNDTILAEAIITIVCVNDNMKPTRIPDYIKTCFI